MAKADKNAKSRYVVGIDLGTTNSSVAYIDTEKPDGEAIIESLPIPQVTAAGKVVARDLLPSFLYLPAKGELPAGSLDLPWESGPSHVVGEFARNHGAQIPHRLVSSAKSWLCHPGVDRRGAILPWQAGDDVEKVSPVEAGTRYLAHMVAAWDEAFAKDDAKLSLKSQTVYLTVPASFDAVSRELTLDAAKKAGLTNVTLLEEPQAAFYAWLSDQEAVWRDLVKVDDVILVCDIGGGTTDFCVIRVQDEGGNLELNRIAVGDHLLLGGDNMDLTLARHVQLELEKKGTKLDNWQFRALWHGCRAAKETLLTDASQEKAPVIIPGRGSSIVGGTIKVEIERPQVESLILDGFFPMVAPEEKPRQAPMTGFKQLGLPYVSDAGVSRHLAHFLTRHADTAGQVSAGGRLRVTKVLFNGGVLGATSIRDRILGLLGSWAGEGGQVGELASTSLAHAVARGAAYYGQVQRGKGVRIRGGAARSYYIGVETSLPAVPGMEPPIRALCVVPHGMEEGQELEVPGGELGLVVGEPARFRFFSSTSRTHDTIGEMLESPEDELTELSPVETTLQSDGHEGTVMPVTLKTRLTEVGTVEVWAVSKDEDRRFRLEYSVRIQGRQ